MTAYLKTSLAKEMWFCQKYLTQNTLINQTADMHFQCQSLLFQDGRHAHLKYNM